MKDKLLLWLGIGGFVLAAIIYLFGAYAGFVLEQRKHSQNLKIWSQAMTNALSTEEQTPILSLDEATGLIFINKGQVDYTEAERLLHELPDIIKAAKIAERELLVNNIVNLEKRLTYMRMRLEVLP